MLAARIFYVIVHGAVAVFAYCKFRRYGYTAVFGTLLYFLFTPYNIMACSYNTMAIDLLVLTGVLLSQYDAGRRLPFILAGVTFAGAVLCSPYLAVTYVLYAVSALIHVLVKKFGKTKNLFADDLFAPRTFLLFSAGVFGLAIIFLIFLLSRASIGDILKSLPEMLKDPEHLTASYSEKFLKYFTSIWESHKPLRYAICAYGVQLLIMLFDRKRSNHRCAYLLTSALLTLFGIALFIPGYSSRTYNDAIFCFVFVGWTAYLLCREKPRRLFVSMTVLGLLYSVAVHMGSNQYFYIIACAFIVVNLANFIYVGQLLREIRENPDEVNYGIALKNASVFAVILIIAVMSVLQLKIKEKHCFWDSTPKALTYEMTAGPAKGILTTDANGQQYDRIYRDLTEAYEGAEPDNILILPLKPWTYLAVDDFPMATSSAWLSTRMSYVESSLKAYYELNPDKLPKYVYIIKNVSKWNLSRVNNIAMEYGYVVEETDVSYRLEKIE